MKILEQATIIALSMLATAAFAGDEPKADEIIQKTRAAYASISSYSDSGTVVSVMSGQTNFLLEFDIRLQRPNLYRINWTQKGGLKPGVSADNGMAWSDAGGDFFQTTSSIGNGPIAKKKMRDMNEALGAANGFSLTATTTLPSAFFGRNLGDHFVYPAIAGDVPLKREHDAKVGNVNCYVLSGDSDLSKTPEAGKSGSVSTTIWIGKDDFLIHRTSVRYFEKLNEDLSANDEVIDQAAKKSLETQNKPVTPEAIAALRPIMKEKMKQVQVELKRGFSEGILYDQIHDHITVNRSYSPSDFLPFKD